MNVLAIIFVIIVAIIAIPLIISLFVAKSYYIESSINIQKNQSSVYNYLRILTNQDKFSKWVMQDPEKRRYFTGEDGTVGFIYAWDSDQKSSGKGEQEIMKLEENKRIDIEVRFEKPFAGIAQTPFIIDDLGNNISKVTWGMAGRNKYPMNFMNLFVVKMLGNDMEQSLHKLKDNLENQS